MCACESLNFCLLFKLILKTYLPFINASCSNMFYVFQKLHANRDLARKVPNNFMYPETLSPCIDKYINKIEFSTLQTEFTVEYNVLQNEFDVE